MTTTVKFSANDLITLATAQSIVNRVLEKRNYPGEYIMSTTTGEVIEYCELKALVNTLHNLTDNYEWEIK